MKPGYIGLKQYEVCQGHICFLACLADLARNMGVDISEEIILGLSTGLQFRTEADQDGHLISTSIECANMLSDKKEIRRCLEMFGICLQVMDMTDITQGIKMMKEKLANGIPVMVSIDIYYMDYHIEYGRKHGGHDIVVFGMDEQRGVVYIADNYIQTITGKTFKGTISIDHLMDAMRSEGEADDFSGYIIFLEACKNGPVITREYICKRIKEAAAGVADKGMENGNVLGSIGLLKRYLSTIKGWENDDILCRQLEQISSRIVGYAGPVPARLLYARFLEWVSGRYALALDQSIVDGYISLSKQWKITGNLFIKMTHVRQQSILQRIINRLDDIEKEELKLAAKCIEFTDNIDDE